MDDRSPSVGSIFPGYLLESNQTYSFNNFAAPFPKAFAFQSNLEQGPDSIFQDSPINREVP
jgi:hypothetical protein